VNGQTTAEQHGKEKNRIGIILPGIVYSDDHFCITILKQNKTTMM